MKFDENFIVIVDSYEDFEKINKFLTSRNIAKWGLEEHSFPDTDLATLKDVKLVYVRVKDKLLTYSTFPMDNNTFGEEFTKAVTINQLLGNPILKYVK